MIHLGDCREILPTLEAESVNCVVTSPPFWGLRDYGTATWEGGDPECKHEGSRRWYTQNSAAQASGEAFSEAGPANASRLKKGRWREGGDCVKCGAVHHDSQIGLEPTPEEYVEAMVGVFREVRRVLRSDGTVWLNLGDSYAGAPVGSFNGGGFKDKSAATGGRDLSGVATSGILDKLKGSGLKPKDLVGIPWRVAFALQADGWFLRSEIIWSKPNPMPESVTDRPTKSHEQVFLLTKSPRYWYDADAVREPLDGPLHNPGNRVPEGVVQRNDFGTERMQAVWGNPAGRNLRSVWTIATQPYPGAHFATFPPKLVEPCILAGCPEKVCVDCGAPWERVVGLGQVVSTGGSDSGRRTAANKSVNLGRGDSNTGAFVAREHVTTGWHPTCAHDAATRPGVVLDPFSGSGTVGMVAEKLSRRSILIELNPAYVEQGEVRTAQRGLGLTA